MGDPLVAVVAEQLGGERDQHDHRQVGQVEDHQARVEGLEPREQAVVD
jgi:hypothetical protein